MPHIKTTKIYVARGFGYGSDSFATSPLENAQVYEGDFVIEKEQVDIPSRGILNTLFFNGAAIARNFKKS